MSFEAVNMITDAEALAKKKTADAETAAKQLIAKARLLMKPRCLKPRAAGEAMKRQALFSRMRRRYALSFVSRRKQSLMKQQN